MITVCGEMVADLIEQPDGLLRPVPGGSPANTALACARLGVAVQFLGRFGHDPFGDRARRRLLDAGVGLEGSVDADEPSTLAVATTDPDGHARYAFWTIGTADWQWSPGELAQAPATGTRVLHTASLASWTPPGAHVIADMAHRARSRGVMVSYDPNVRPSLLGDEARTLVRRAVRLAHVVKVSDDDLRVLHPSEDPLDVARRWLEDGPAVVVVTAGVQGAVALRRGRSDVAVPGARVTVADTIGAGDTFTAGLLVGLLEELPAEMPDPTPDRDAAVAALDALDDDGLARALGVAAAAAGITVTRHGCDPPTMDEVRTARRQA